MKIGAIVVGLVVADAFSKIILNFFLQFRRETKNIKQKNFHLLL